MKTSTNYMPYTHKEQDRKETNNKREKHCVMYQNWSPHKYKGEKEQFYSHVAA